MTEIKGATTTVIQMPLDQYIEIMNRFERHEELLQALAAEIKHLHTYPHLPPWLTAKQALELLPVSDYRTLNRYVERGIIEAKNIAENGNKRAYKKADVLNAAERAERYLSGEE